jgi:hypothetical protein
MTVSKAIQEEFNAFSKLEPEAQAADAFQRYTKLKRIDQICIMVHLAKQCYQVTETQFFVLFAQHNADLRFPLEVQNEPK